MQSKDVVRLHDCTFSSDIESGSRASKSHVTVTDGNCVGDYKRFASSKIESVRRTCPVSVVKQCAERFMTLMRSSGDDDVSLVRWVRISTTYKLLTSLEYENRSSSHNKSYVVLNRSETLSRDLNDRSQRLERVERESIRQII